MCDMDDHELDKTFVERSPSSLIPSAYAHGGNGAPQSNTKPVVGQTRFGFCVVKEVIGEGGMATVYKVWNERLEVFRAVKLLSQESFSARFETEAKITAKLHHPGIVEIHNIGEWNGLPYMEMEFVDGSDLQQTLAERGKLPEIVCIAIALRVAEALAHAHTKDFTLVGKQYCGIIHRDLKPANIMISKQGEVKLTDFGIARPAQTSLHTVVGNIAGTMHYLSPEQMNGEEVDNRSDIYSFGTILYEMITGAKTFPQGSIIDLMKQKSANKFKSPSEYGIPINPDLVKIILRCLKFAPAKRYQSTQELVNDLKELNDSLTKRMPREVVENYLNGIEDANLADSGKTKQLWILGKPKTAEQSTKQKPSEVSDKPETPEPEPDEKPQPANVKTTDKPEAVSVPKTSKVAGKPTIWARLLQTILFVPRWIRDKIKTAGSSAKPKPVKTSTKPKSAKLSDKPQPAKKSAVLAKILSVVRVVPQWIMGKIKAVRTSMAKPKKPKPVKAAAKPKPQKLPKPPKMMGNSTVSTKSLRKALIVPMLLLAVLVLSYVTIKVFTGKPSTTKTKSLINAAAALDSVKTVAADDTAKKTSDTTAANSIGDTVVTPKKAFVATRPILDSVVTNPDTAMSESEQLRAAVAASKAKNWDLAIEILEQDDVFKEKNDYRTLHLLNAYVESRRFDKAQTIVDTVSFILSQDAYFLLCIGKSWYYRRSPDKAIKFFETSLNNSSIMDADKTLPGTALYFIADIKQERFKATPSASNRSSALEAWHEVRAAFASKQNDSRAKRAEREISALEAGN